MLKREVGSKQTLPQREGEIQKYKCEVVIWNFYSTMVNSKLK